MKKYDVIIIGAGAAGLSAARAAISHGRSVAIIDMGATPARKVAVSGGGRCNFTNAAATRDRYFGTNPDFVRGALARVTPDDILDWARRHNISWSEKSAGQYFGDNAQSVVNALVSDTRGAKIILGDAVLDVQHNDTEFIIRTQSGTYAATSVIVASGGVSFPTLGVSDIGYKIAKHFGHKIVPPRPALCAIVTDAIPPELAGISLNAKVTCGRDHVTDSMLFTHSGIGGPVAYRTTVRDCNDDLILDLLPDVDAFAWLRTAKQTMGAKSPGAILSEKLPARVARWIADGAPAHIADMRDTALATMAQRINHIVIAHDKYRLHGMSGAEVTRGGIATDDISSKTMESKIRPGLFFAGEVLDIAGDLGGFNLHWAWASGTIAGQNA